MTISGVFITLYDQETLKLYLEKGIYGFLMSPENQDSPYSKHYNALADYSCLRKGHHVFFFLRRKIVYGGQICGYGNYAAFFLNGKNSAMGSAASARLGWDEGTRDIYHATDTEGVFLVNDIGERCQPYLIRFEDKLGLKGKYIFSDDLYWKLGDYAFPLPSNSIQGMGFCILTPVEAQIAIGLLQSNPRGIIDPVSDESIVISSNLTPFTPAVSGINNLCDACSENLFTNEAHLEATITANPMLLPENMRPGSDEVICRQIPISPFKPANMDRADICYFSESFSSGALPTTIIELKNRTADQNSVKQITRYLDWIYRISGQENAGKVKAFVLAPNFRGNITIPDYSDQIELISIL
jgi:hypothetical protein